MKLYQKPLLLNKEFTFRQEIAAGLNEWLSQNSLTDAGITTYVILS